MAGAERAPPHRGDVAGNGVPCRPVASGPVASSPVASSPVASSPVASSPLSDGEAADGSAPVGVEAAFRGFRRARLLLWCGSTVSVLAGVVLHDAAVRSAVAHLLWLGVVAITVGAPLHRLLAFRCPRCSAVYLSTGGWYDFLGIGRVLWSQRCGHCAFPAVRPSSSCQPESGPS